MCIIFFFFKQKTAYELRISDWSSDVCSSDLAFDCRLWKIVDDGGQSSRRNREGLVVPIVGIEGHYAALQLVISGLRLHADLEVGVLFGIGRGGTAWPDERCVEGRRLEAGCDIGIDHHLIGRLPRSEEHTSELQSLMRISYAVFCLKKKKHTQ